MKIDKKRIVVLSLRALVFLIILVQLFLVFTYLFRNTRRDSRGTILEYYELEENTLDAVFIGSSAVMRYYDPLRAWNEYGFASQNYSVSGMHVGTYLAAIKDALKTQNPEVVVVNARGFTASFANNEITAGARNFFDSIDYDMFRIQSVHYYCEKMDIPWKDRLPLYVDLIYYHNNYAALVDGNNWELSDNRLDGNIEYDLHYKGYGFKDKIVMYTDPSKNLVEESVEIAPIAEELFIDIIEYCQENEIKLLFWVSPTIITKQDSGKYNTLAEIADSYNIDFLDLNRCYEEIGLNFSYDFYDKNHTNIIGADKVTDYMASYLMENYDLPNHKDEESYDSWDQLYDEYIVEAEKARKIVSSQKRQIKNAYADEKKMQESVDILEWLSLADNDEMTLIIAANEPIKDMATEELRLLLYKFGIQSNYWSYAKIFNNVYSNEVISKNVTKTSQTGKIGTKKISYKVEFGENFRISVNKDIYELNEKGIYIVAFDNNKNQVFDVVNIQVDENDNILFKHVNN